MSKTKIEYLEYKFSNVTQETDVKVRLDTQVISKRRSFKYIGSIIQVMKRSHIILEWSE